MTAWSSSPHPLHIYILFIMQKNLKKKQKTTTTKVYKKQYYDHLQT